jgi:aspartate/methionine/tyrosine aminotransferase
MAGGTCSFVTLRLDEEGSGKWELDLAEFEAAITPKTKLLLLNNPHNPTGKVFTMEEMQGIADIVHRNPHVTVV